MQMHRVKTFEYPRFGTEYHSWLDIIRNGPKYVSNLSILVHARCDLLDKDRGRSLGNFLGCRPRVTVDA